jgi:hypothetical protein
MMMVLLTYQLTGERTDINGPDMSEDEQVQGEIASQWQDEWTWTPNLTEDNFVESNNSNNNYLQLFFGGWGYDLRDNIELYTQNNDITDHFSNDWDGGYRDENLNASESWVKHVLSFTTDASTGEVTTTYQILDSEGDTVGDTSIVRSLNVDIDQASWSHLVNSDEKGGFRFRLMMIEQGDVAIDNLKVTDLTDDTIILSSDFTQGNEGIFSPLY